MVEQACLIGIGIVVALIIAYIALSFSSLEYNEYGLDYSGIWKEVDKSYYSGGIHFLGFKHSFIVFPKSVQTIEFGKKSDNGAMKSRTSDGLEVILDISFQYELQPKRLYELYMAYGENYEGRMVTVAMDSINKVSNNYTAYNFFINRSEIGDSMKNELDVAMDKIMCATIKFFQLKNVDLPDPFEDAIQQTEVKKQDIEKAKAEKAKVEVEIETKIQIAEQNKNIILNNAQGEANAITSNNEAHVNAFNFTETNYIDGLYNVKEGANLTNQGLLNFIKASIIENYSGDHLIIALD